MENKIECPSDCANCALRCNEEGEVAKGKNAAIRKYIEDWRKENPALHLFYVKCAVTHLVALDQCIERLGSFSNFNLMDAEEALYNAREKLVIENAAYADAEEILNSLKERGKEKGVDE